MLTGLTAFLACTPMSLGAIEYVSRMRQSIDFIK